MSQLPDKNDKDLAESRMMSASKALHQMADDVAQAIQAKHFVKRDENKLEKKYMKRYLDAGYSAAKAEAYALADPEFDKEDLAQREAYLTFTKVLVRWENEQRSFDAARSMLSYARESLRNEL